MFDSVKEYVSLAAMWLWDYRLSTFGLVYMAGVIATVFALVYKAWKEDAEEARWRTPSGDPELIYNEMSRIGKAKRLYRVRRLVTHSLFWPLILGWKLLWKGVYFAGIYPFLLVADRKKTAIIEGASKQSLARRAAEIKPVMIDCGKCGKMVKITERHSCGVHYIG